jgi:hypothetical protein
MTISFSAPATAGAGALLCALFLAGCDRPSAPAPAAPGVGAEPAIAADGLEASRHAPTST